MSAKDKKL